MTLALRVHYFRDVLEFEVKVFSLLAHVLDILLIHIHLGLIPIFLIENIYEVLLDTAVYGIYVHDVTARN